MVTQELTLKFSKKKCPVCSKMVESISGSKAWHGDCWLEEQAREEEE